MAGAGLGWLGRQAQKKGALRLPVLDSG